MRSRPLFRSIAAALLVCVLGAVGVGAGTAAAGAASTASTSVARSSQSQCGTDLTTNAAAPALSTDISTIGADQTVTVNVTGSRYLTGLYQCGSQKFGGVYVFFGWVQPGGQWGPGHRNETSMQGQFGTTYSYPGEGGSGEVRDDGSGIVRLVSFTQGGESGQATDFHMDANGNWQANLVVRGATYTFKDLVSGNQSTVDCRLVQCGIFTIGAHGISSRTNELFTPITFTDAAGAAVVPPSGGAASGTGGAVSGAQGGTGGAAQGGATDDGGGTRVAGGATGLPSGAASTTTTASASAPGEVGSVGEAPAGESAEDAGVGGDREVLNSDNAASVQEFGAPSGGSGGGPVIIIAVLLALVVVAGGVVVLRRRSTAAAAGATE